MTEAPTPLLWARQPREPMRWFARFERFRRAGPNRSLLGTFNAYLAEGVGGSDGVGEGTGRKRERPREHAPRNWRETARKWRWTERAEAWDAHELEADAAAFAQARRDSRRDRIGVLNLMLARAAEALNGLVAQQPMGVRDAIQAIQHATEGLRREYGDEVQRHAVTIADDARAEELVRRLAEADGTDPEEAVRQLRRVNAELDGATGRPEEARPGRA